MIDRIPWKDVGFVVAMSPADRICVVAFALQIISSLRGMANFQPQVAKLSNLQNLKELQLVMYGMNTVMLSHIYGFLRMCHCSRLRNLFMEVSAWYMSLQPLFCCRSTR